MQQLVLSRLLFARDANGILSWQEVNLWKLMGDFNLLGITAPGNTQPFLFPSSLRSLKICVQKHLMNVIVYKLIKLSSPVVSQQQNSRGNFESCSINLTCAF